MHAMTQPSRKCPRPPGVPPASLNERFSMAGSIAEQAEDRRSLLRFAITRTLQFARELLQLVIPFLKLAQVNRPNPDNRTVSGSTLVMRGNVSLRLRGTKWHDYAYFIARGSRIGHVLHNSSCFELLSTTRISTSFAVSVRRKSRNPYRRGPRLCLFTCGWRPNEYILGATFTGFQTPLGN